MTDHHVLLLFVELAVILLVARALGHLAARIHQPPVLGEIAAGILLGPTLLGTAVSGVLFPPDLRPVLTGMANVGIALFMFVVGLEIEDKPLRRRGRITVGTTAGSVLVPFALGVLLALFLLRTHDVGNPPAFVVFVALAVSVTAFPVLARILTDRKLTATLVGGVAVAVAATVDLIAWAGLAGLQASIAGGRDFWRIALLLPYTALMFLVVRPLLRRLVNRNPADAPLAPARFLVLVVGALLSAAATEAMGLHFIFGAFLFGLVVPRPANGADRGEIPDRVSHLTSVLLPVYFVVAGLKVDLTSLGPGQFAELGLIVLVAVLGKFGGTYLGARLSGLRAGPASALAALMNTRGLTELVILGVGLELGLLDSSLYSLMVVMTLITTAMTGPLLTLVHRGQLRRGVDPPFVPPGPAAVNRDQLMT